MGNDVLADVPNGLQLGILWNGSHLTDEGDLVGAGLLEAGDVADVMFDVILHEDPRNQGPTLGWNS